MPSRTRTIAGTAAFFAALALALTPTAAHAVTSPAYYGYADCAGTARPGTQALHTGQGKHQIGFDSAGGWYSEKIANMGANPGYSRFKFLDNRYAAWATISSPGGQRLISTSWACRAASWS